jgi:hypothetical protein
MSDLWATVVEGTEMAAKQSKRPAKRTQKDPPKKLEPVYVEVAEGQDVMSMLYVANGEGGYTSLANLPPALGGPAEVPGVATAHIIQASGALRSISVSPYRICCQFTPTGQLVCKIC